MGPTANADGFVSSNTTTAMNGWQFGQKWRHMWISERKLVKDNSSVHDNFCAGWMLVSKGDNYNGQLLVIIGTGRNTYWLLLAISKLGWVWCEKSGQQS